MILPHEKELQLKALFARMADLVAREAGYARTCLSCHHFDEGTEVCRKWQRRPPAKVIVNSCPEWEKEPF